jgi:hypothetical protein
MRKRQYSSVGMPKGYRLDGWDFISGRGKIFLFSIVSRLDLGPTHTPLQWGLGSLSLVVK